ncbi:MAG: DUF1800 domain-containing protein [Candidatus Hydrogenedentes bacterium]|nr:DUF1800 domain-containing protein [Candidatus Hydrogenedentota bacterium]
MNLTRRGFLQYAGSAGVLAASGCDVLRGQAWLAGKRNSGGPWLAPQGDSVDDISHVLSRLTYGTRPGDYARVKALGVEAFIEEQLAPEIIVDHYCEYAVRRLETLHCPAVELFEYKDTFLLGEISRATLLRAVYSERQLYEVMVGFWTDHFNIAWNKGDCKWLKAADDRDVIRRHALGTFPELLRASALSPAMLWYLDGRVNRRRRPDEKPNENYARELMELHTLGVDGGYSQHDVMEVARCLTGWTVRSEQVFGKGRVEFHPELHDDGPKEVLGEKIPGGRGEKDLDEVLRIVTTHPSTANYLARRLCRHFIHDVPPDDAVAEVAAAYTHSAGDIPAMLRVLFHTDAFRTARGTKFKRPFHFLASVLRGTQAETDVGEPLLDYLLRMGHAPFQYPTPDGYPDEAAPWMGSLLWRWHFVTALSQDRLPGVRVLWRQLKDQFGGDTQLIAHLLGRLPTAAEQKACSQWQPDAALALALPGFQQC